VCGCMCVCTHIVFCTHISVFGQRYTHLFEIRGGDLQYKHTYVHTHEHIHIHIYAHTHAHANAHALAHARTQAHTYTHTHTHTHSARSRTSMSLAHSLLLADICISATKSPMSPQKSPTSPQKTALHICQKTSPFLSLSVSHSLSFFLLICRALLCADIRLSNRDVGLFVWMQTSFAETQGSLTDI